jgi:hypothetical protein
MSSQQRVSRYGGLTVDRARSLRVQQALLSALYAQRAEDARADGEDLAVAHWRDKYRTSVRKCRLLGERIREERSPSPPPAGTSRSNVARLKEQAQVALPQTGRAA